MSDAKGYLEPLEIERIVKAYSDHIMFPIELVSGGGEPRQINTASALWQRPKSELKPDDYHQVYRTISGGFDEPAMTLHYKVEGRQAYAVLLYAPSTRPSTCSIPPAKGGSSCTSGGSSLPMTPNSSPPICGFSMA